MTGRAAVTLAGLALVAACDPRDFDNLSESTWVDSSESPAGLDATDYGAALAFGGAGGDGTRLVVASLAPPGIASLSFGADGTRETIGALIASSVPGGTLPTRPALAGDPSGAGGDEGTVAVGVLEDSGASRILLLDPASLAVTRSIPVDAAEGVADGLAFGATDADGDAATVDLVALGGASLSIVGDYQDAQDLATCALPRELGFAAAAADFDPQSPGEELAVTMGNDGAAGAAADLAIVTGAAVAAADAAGEACTDGGRTPLVSAEAPGEEADFGVAITAGDFDGSGTPDLAVGAPSSSTVYLWMNVDVAAGAPAPVALPGPSGSAEFGHALAAGDLDGDGAEELIVGDPGAPTDGVAGAGAVRIYAFEGTTPDRPVTLADASPDGEQRFGRAVATAPFGDAETVLAVGAATEVFTYFRTPLADDLDVRQ